MRAEASAVAPGAVRVTYLSDHGRVLFDTDLTRAEARSLIDGLTKALGSKPN